VINYPPDRRILEQATEQDLPNAVLVRDLVRVVEVLNLKRQGFFGKHSVLAGSMALRSFGSPRFTVYDADFATSSEVVDPPTAMKGKLAYRDDDLEISASDLTPHDAGGTAWKSAPVVFEPVFTSLVPQPSDRTFKVDVSFRGLQMPGLEVPLRVPYELDIWDHEPAVFVMDPHEIVADKILGWCVHRLLKHYADLGYVALASHPEAKPRGIDLDYSTARDVTAAKLEAMRRLQPSLYAPFPNVDALIGELARPLPVNRNEWTAITYVRSARDRLAPELVVRAVREVLAEGLRRAGRR
jgi:hypothetical protein